MNEANSPPLTPEQEQNLAELAKSANEKLEGASQASAYRAFNLGCMLGLVPAALAALVAFFLIDFSWIAAVLTGLVMLLAFIGFAALAAVITRARRMDRVYQEEVQVEIEQALQANGTDVQAFSRVARAELPPNAAIGRYLGWPEPGQVENQAERV